MSEKIESIPTKKGMRFYPHPFLINQIDKESVYCIVERIVISRVTVQIQVSVYSAV